MRRRFELIVMAPPVLVAIAAYVPLTRAGVSVIAKPFFGLSVLAVGFMALIAVYERRDRRLAEVLRISAIGILLSVLYPFPMYLIAVRGRPFADASLAQLDALVGARTATFVAWTQASPALAWATGAAYASLRYELVIALMLVPLAGETRRAREFLLSLVYASIASLTLFAFVQAIGPWQDGSFAPAPLQASTETLLRTLHAGGPVILDIGSPGALIACPSWHTILAILTGYALSFRRATAVPAALWSAAVVASTLTSGWHYVTDVLAGVLVAGGAAWAARWTGRQQGGEWLCP